MVTGSKHHLDGYGYPPVTEYLTGFSRLIIRTGFKSGTIYTI
jgi:hypothetical protein